MSQREIVKNFVSAHPSDISDHLLQMYDTIIQRSPKLIIELGVRGGMSTFAISRAAQDIGARLISVDITDCSKSCDWSKWEFLKMNDLNFADTFKDKIDILFIDTSHTFDHTVSELRKFLPLMHDKGIIILHDTNVCGSEVARAIDKVFGIKGNWGINFSIKSNHIKIKNYAHNNGMAYLFLR